MVFTFLLGYGIVPDLGANDAPFAGIKFIVNLIIAWSLPGFDPCVYFRYSNLMIFLIAVIRLFGKCFSIVEIDSGALMPFLVFR